MQATACNLAEQWRRRVGRQRLDKQLEAGGLYDKKLDAYVDMSVEGRWIGDMKFCPFFWLLS